MQKFRLKFKPTEAELFFIEKSVELLHRNTIDTYRLRINNSKTVVQELLSVCLDLKVGHLKNHDYAKALAKECMRTLGKCDILNFHTIRKDYYIGLLDKLASNSSQDYGIIIHASEIVLSDNLGILKDVVKRIGRTILKCNSLSSIPGSFINGLSNLIQFFLVELVLMGFTKHYLVNFYMSIFAGIEDYTFIQRFLIIKSLVARKEEVFNVIIGINSEQTSLKRLQLDNKQIQSVTKRIRKRLTSISNDKCKEFFDNNDGHFLYNVRVSSIDYYRALLDANRIFSHQLDILHLGYSNERFDLIEDCLIVGEENPLKASKISNTYKYDGLFRSKHSLFKYVHKRFREIETDRINGESLNRIYAGIRYFRYASESNEVEVRFINYWIALEHIFSSQDASEYTIGRLRDYFKNCHALVYFKRNLTEYHRDLKKLAIDIYIQGYSDDLNYLKNESTYKIVQARTESPLLKQRSLYYLERLNSPEKLRGSLERHKQNIEWNLTRIYRIRNEIVHNAATKSNIYTVTSHLRYYLTFILNSIIEFYIQNQKKYTSKNQLHIEDYFILQNLQIGSLESKPKDLTLALLLEQINPLEVFI